MLWTFCPPTIWVNSLEFSRNCPKLSADKLYRACELKDQTYKKTRTLHFSELHASVQNGAFLVQFYKYFLFEILFFWCVSVICSCYHGLQRSMTLHRIVPNAFFCCNAPFSYTPFGVLPSFAITQSHSLEIPQRESPRGSAIRQGFNRNW